MFFLSELELFWSVVQETGVNVLLISGLLSVMVLRLYVKQELCLSGPVLPSSRIIDNQNPSHYETREVE